MMSIMRHTNRLMPRVAAYSTEVNPPSPKTAIVMLNMGGPKTVYEILQNYSLSPQVIGMLAIISFHELALPLNVAMLQAFWALCLLVTAYILSVGDYLHRIMTDRDMIQLPVQKRLGPWIASRRTSEVQKKYMEIGGGSPILRWTNLQGELLTKQLDTMLPESAPHKHYVAFRYVPPYTEDTFNQLEEDGVERAVIFSQYPQYSCATTGSSLNAIADVYRKRNPPNIKFSLIERWGNSKLLAQCFAERICEKLDLFPDKVKNDVLILFTAHSLPLKAVNRGDTYPSEVAATVSQTMSELRVPNPHRLVWQSKVGPLPWLQPYTDDAIKAYSSKGHKNMILVPIAFVNEHIETLHELDIEYCQDVAAEAGVAQIERVATPNDHPTFIAALAETVANHLKLGPPVSKQFLIRCPHCVSPRCDSSKKFFKNLCSENNKRDIHRDEDIVNVI